MAQLPADDTLMTPFVASLHDLQVQSSLRCLEPNTVIKLPVGVFWLGSKSVFTNEIFIRPAYVEMLEAREAYREAGREFNVTLFTGTPGVGKSHLCALLLARALIDGQMVLFERYVNESPASSDIFTLQLQPDGEAIVVELSHRKEAKTILQRSDGVVYFVDGGSQSMSSHIHDRETFIFTSANPGVFRDAKKHARTLILYTPLFDLEELHLCRDRVTQFQDVKHEDVDAAFTLAGGIARSALLELAIKRPVGDLQDRVYSKVTGYIGHGLETELAQLASNGFPPGSDLIFHWAVEVADFGERRTGSPPEDRQRRFTRKYLRLASPYVVALFSIKLHMNEMAQVALFCMTTANQRQQAVLRGYWHEQLCHIMLVGGGKFRCRMLGTDGVGQEFYLHLPPAEVVGFHSAKQAGEQTQPNLTTYCLPEAPNHPAIDSLSSPALMYQMTSGKSHPISLSGLKKLLKELPPPSVHDFDQLRIAAPELPELDKPLLVFVLPPSSYDSNFLTAQTYKDGGVRGDQMPLVHQAKLCLPLDRLVGISSEREAKHLAALRLLTQPPS